MNFDDVPEFLAICASAKDRYYARMGVWPNQEQLAAEIPCPLRTFHAWKRRAKEHGLWLERPRVRQQEATEVLRQVSGS